MFISIKTQLLKDLFVAEKELMVICPVTGKSFRATCVTKCEENHFPGFLDADFYDLNVTNPLLSGQSGPFRVKGDTKCFPVPESFLTKLLEGCTVRNHSLVLAFTGEPDEEQKLRPEAFHFGEFVDEKYRDMISYEACDPTKIYKVDRSKVQLDYHFTAEKQEEGTYAKVQINAEDWVYVLL